MCSSFRRKDHFVDEHDIQQDFHFIEGRVRRPVRCNKASNSLCFAERACSSTNAICNKSFTWVYFIEMNISSSSTICNKDLNFLYFNGGTNSTTNAICNKTSTSSKGQSVERCDMQQSPHFIERTVRRMMRYATKPPILSILMDSDGGTNSATNAICNKTSAFVEKTSSSINAICNKA
jgi:hypothetical protein